ncbi:MAG TPA: hypothetical protein VMU81_28290 [Acetobacteraceae bacterium]|jgi:hypothetical protein|nr:hypothetical protein [Acetobacteraceae bacterium]
MTVAQLVHPFHTVRDDAQPSPLARVRAMQQRAARHLGNDKALWGAIGAGWAFALAAFGILAVAL